VRIPDTDRMGDVGRGWAVAMDTMTNARSSVTGGQVSAMASLDAALALWASCPRTDPVWRDQLVRLWIEAQIEQVTHTRALAARIRGHPGPESSVGKAAWASLNQRIWALCVDLLGAEGMLYGNYAMTRPASALESNSVQKSFLRSRANSIEGGTSEIQKNVLAERVLGLPRETAGHAPTPPMPCN
jgi:alkylation response protein AidB-like acyl-CoA dehydrogenase